MKAEFLDKILTRIRGLRPGSEALTPVRDRLTLLRQWQSQRLENTYADFSVRQKFHDAVDFFLNDLYGSRNFERRDHELERALPLLKRALPASALSALAHALELEALSLSLDAEMARHLPLDCEIDEHIYAETYRRVGRVEDRQAQIRLGVEAGELLEKLVKRRTVGLAIRLAHGPAHMAGFGALHDFLERGFFSFKKMDDVNEFLRAIDERETRIMNAILAGEGRPLVQKIGVRL